MQAAMGLELAMSRPNSCLALQGRAKAKPPPRAPVLVVATHQPPIAPRLLAHLQRSVLRHIPKRVSKTHVVHSSSLTGNQPSTDSGDGGKGLPPVNGGSGGGGGEGEGAGGDQPEEVVLPAGKTIDNLPTGAVEVWEQVWKEVMLTTHPLIHTDMQTAFSTGKIPQLYIDRFFSMNANFFLAFLLRFQYVCAEKTGSLFGSLVLPPQHAHKYPHHHQTPNTRGLRDRLLADPSFLIKLGIEVWCCCSDGV